MIPLDLELKNFLSYGEEPTKLSLEGMHTICLSGDNGHGKSALLDAITWALWGETRLGKQNHDQLIRMGSDEMWVILTFEVNSQRYRIRRQRNRRAGGQLWELQQDDGAGGWRSLTGVAVSDTERTIKNLLRMSYDTFLNSAYLRQGRADEFVRQTANRRKEILSEILDLSRYDDLEARARAKMRDACDRGVEAERRLNVANATIADEPRLREQLAACLTGLADSSTEKDALSGEWDEARETRNALVSQRTRAQQVDGELRRIDNDTSAAKAEEQTEAAEIVRLEQLLAQRSEIERDFDTLVKARERCDILQAQVEQMHRLRADRSTAEFEIEGERKRLTTERDTALREAAECIARIDALSKTNADLARIVEQLPDLDAKAARLAQVISVEIPETRDSYGELKRDVANSTAEITALHERLARLSEQEEMCSVCGSPMPPDKVEALLDEVEMARVDALRLSKEREALLAKCWEDVERLKAEPAGLEQAAEQRKRLDAEADRLRQSLASLPDLESRRAAAERDAASRIADLAADAFAADARARLALLTKSLADLDGADTRYEETRKLVRQLEPAERQKLALEHAQEQIDAASRRLRSIADRLATLSDARNALIAERASFVGLDEKIKALDEMAERLKAKRQDVETRLSAAHQERGRLDASLALCDKAREDKLVLEREHVRAKREEEIYKQLTAAFGRQGVQALIIENAIPEIQIDANDILGKLTDGDMTLAIETRRAGRVRGAGEIETLDIRVSDSHGTRPLELYSGGETFRISFALRIALSKMLARRAGARLQTLIIDEGFGTQDGKGREKLVDAVHAIKDDFEKIILITHVEELKDAFPSRIEVLKTPLGSQLTITEGGIIG